MSTNPSDRAPDEGTKERVLKVHPQAEMTLSGDVYTHRGIAGEYLGHGWEDAAARVSRQSAPAVNYVSEAKYSYGTATCKICGAMATPGGKCASCGGTDLAIPRNDRPMRIAFVGLCIVSGIWALITMPWELLLSWGLFAVLMYLMYREPKA